MASSLMHYAITDKILQLFPMHDGARLRFGAVLPLSLIHISEPTRP